MADFETHLVYPAAVFTYKDGRPPWFVLPHLRGSVVRCIARLDDDRCLLVGSENDVAVVDVARQRTLEKGSFSASTFYIASLAQSLDRKRAVLYSGGLDGIALIEVDPLKVTYLDRMARTDTGFRFLNPGESASDSRRSNAFYNAAFRHDGKVIMTRYTGAYYEESAKHNTFLVLDPDTLEVTQYPFDNRYDFPIHGWFSPSGRWLLTLRQSTVEFFEPSLTGRDGRFFGLDQPATSHPDLTDGSLPRWGLQLELWDMNTWKLKRVIACRFYEEKELLDGWLLHFPPGEADLIWQHANWFGLLAPLSPDRIGSMSEDQVKAYNETRQKKYAEVRRTAESHRSQYIDKLVFISKCNAQTRNEYEKKAPQSLADHERRDLFERVKDIAWSKDESFFVVLFADAIVRKIDIIGTVHAQTEIERFRREAWRQFGISGSPLVSASPVAKVVVLPNNAVRVWGAENQLSHFGFLEFDHSALDTSTVITKQNDRFITPTSPELKKQISEAQAKADQYRIQIQDLSEKTCIQALQRLQSDIANRLESTLLLKNFEPFFELPDQILTEEEFFAHARANCPGAAFSLRSLINTLLDRWRTVPDNRGQILWKDEMTEALAYGLTALGTLDEASFDLVKRYLDELDLDHTVYFRDKFFEDVAPSGRWHDPRWLAMALQHLSGDFAGDHWATLGFRQAANKLPSASVFLDLFCKEFELAVRPQLEARAARYPEYIAARVRYRAEYIARGEIIPYVNSEASDDKPIDVEAEIAEWIDIHLGSFIKKNLATTDPLDVWLRNQLVTLRPSVEEQL